jgi:DNA-binding NarL/FixJ family response regulator
LLIRGCAGVRELKVKTSEETVKMESEVRNIWLVSDKTIYLDAYRKAFEKIEESWMYCAFEITEHHSAIAAMNSLEALDPNTTIHIVYLQISNSIGFKANNEVGDSFGSAFRNRFPESTIILGTNFSQNYNIWNLTRQIKPQALISEDSNTPSELPSQIAQVLKNPPYICDTFKRAIMAHLQREVDLDRLELRLLYELSKGTRMAELPNILNLSISTLEKRKKRLKELFDVVDGDDWALIEKARESGSL